MYFHYTYYQNLSSRLRHQRGGEYWLDGATYDVMTGMHTLKEHHPDDKRVLRKWVTENWNLLDRSPTCGKLNRGEKKDFYMLAPPREPSILEKIWKISYDRIRNIRRTIISKG